MQRKKVFLNTVIEPPAFRQGPLLIVSSYKDNNAGKEHTMDIDFCLCFQMESSNRTPSVLFDYNRKYNLFY